MDKNNRFHPLDTLIADDSIFLLETLVPFVEFPFKRMLVFYIKYRELTSIISSLNNRDFIKSCGFDCHPKSTEDMIQDMCKFMPGNIAGNIKQMQKMFSMMQMMNQGGAGSTNPFSSIFNSSGTTPCNECSAEEASNNSSNNFMDNISPENMAKAFNMFSQINQQVNEEMNNDHTDYKSANDDLFDSVLSILDEEQYY